MQSSLFSHCSIVCSEFLLDMTGFIFFNMILYSPAGKVNIKTVKISYEKPLFLDSRTLVQLYHAWHDPYIARELHAVCMSIWLPRFWAALAVEMGRSVSPLRHCRDVNKDSKHAYPGLGRAPVASSKLLVLIEISWLRALDCDLPLSLPLSFSISVALSYITRKGDPEAQGIAVMYDSCYLELLFQRETASWYVWSQKVEGEKNILKMYIYHLKY